MGPGTSLLHRRIFSPFLSTHKVDRQLTHLLIMSDDETKLEMDLPEKKKKRKKKKKKDKGTADDDEAASDDAAAPAGSDDGGDDDDGEGEGSDLDMDLPDKKAKKKKRKHKSKDKASAAVGAIPADGEDWTYDQLLTRVFETIHAANPDHDNASTTVELEAPALVRVGTKKTGIVNFKEICEAMNRPLDHVLSFVLAELGTTGTFAADHRLTLKGRFQNRHIENVLRHYVSNYLICQNCHSPNTVLTKENRLQFVVCQTCKSSRSVAAVDRGYQAQIGRRRKR